MGGQGTPSLSPTPSPAGSVGSIGSVGSVGSIGSQSSGYNSGELTKATSTVPSAAVPTPAPSPVVHVPVPVFNAMQKQAQFFSLYFSFEDLWNQADTLIVQGNHKG